MSECFDHNPGQKGKEHLTKYELFMLKILESIRCCLWRGVNSCLTWLRTVRRDGRKCACLFFIRDMFGWKYTSPIFPYIPPLTRNCTLTTHFRDYDQICWWYELLRRVTSASPGGGSFVKKSKKKRYRPSFIVWVLAHANASSLQNDLFIFILSEVKRASGAIVLRCWLVGYSFPKEWSSATALGSIVRTHTEQRNLQEVDV